MKNIMYIQFQTIVLEPGVLVLLSVFISFFRNQICANRYKFPTFTGHSRTPKKI